MKYVVILFFLLCTVTINAAEKSIRVFVALCDNASQGIIPVPPKIGNGDDLDGNLYWGCGEGLRGAFKDSKSWKLTDTKRAEKQGDATILEELQFKHAATGAVLIASAYRGSRMKQCLMDFEEAIRAGKHDLVVYIGHNGLMDERLPLVRATPDRKTDVIVLCCKSEEYFKDRILAQGGRPVLLTADLMYPGAFILRDAAKSWLDGEKLPALRDAAARAYAKNQSISVKSAAGVFAKLE